MTKTSQKVRESSAQGKAVAYPPELKPRRLEDVIAERGFAWGDALGYANEGDVRVLCLRADLPFDSVAWRAGRILVHMPKMMTTCAFPDFDFAIVRELGAGQDIRQVADGTRAVKAIRFEAVVPRSIVLERLDHVDLDEGVSVARTGETFTAPRPLQGVTGTAIPLERSQLWIMPAELDAVMRRPRLATDVIADGLVAKGDLLDAIATKRVRAYYPTSRLPAVVWASTRTVPDDPNDPDELVGRRRISFPGLIGPPRPAPIAVGFVAVDRLAEGSTAHDLTNDTARIDVASFDVPNLRAFDLYPDDGELIDLEIQTRGTGARVSVSLADLWIYPDELAALADKPALASRVKPTSRAADWKEAAFLRADALWCSDFNKWTRPNGGVAIERLALALRDGDDGGAPITHVALGTITNALNARRARFTVPPSSPAS